MYKYQIKGFGNKKKIISSPIKLDSPYLELVLFVKDSPHMNGVVPQDEQGKAKKPSQT